MRAAQVSAYGDPSVVKVVDVDKPEVAEGQVLVKVHAASLNPFDTSVRAGYVAKALPEPPFTLGGDIAGVVVEVGDGVSHVSIGDKIYGQAQVIAGNSGAFAEFAVTKASQVAKMPQNLDFQEAASLPLVGVSALQGIYEHINLQKDQKILIVGGSGGIGAVAVQVAKHVGAYVAATASGDGLALVEKLGADEVIDYKVEAFEDTQKGYDAAFDTAGGENFDKTLRVLKQGGVTVSMIAPPNEALASELGVTAIQESTHVNTEVLDKLRELVEAKVVVPKVAQVFKLDEVVKAFEARENAHLNGKIVLAIQ